MLDPNQKLMEDDYNKLGNDYDCPLFLEILNIVVLTLLLIAAVLGYF